MENITISIDNELLRKTRMVARQRDQSVNAFIRGLIVQTVELAGFPDDYLAMADSLKVSSGGKKWHRESLYQRR